MSLKAFLEELKQDYSGDLLSFRNPNLTTLRGGSGNDTLTGGATVDRIVGMGGDDTISGLGGKDFLKGYAGNDTMQGGAGNDVVLGGYGNDVVYGNAGTDILFNSGGNDQMFGGIGDDFMMALFGNNIMNGGDGEDVMIGGVNADIMNGGTDADVISAGSGDDDVRGGGGNDRIQGYFGNDTLRGQRGDDTLFADYGADDLFGGNGDDVINKYGSLALNRIKKIVDAGFDGHSHPSRPADPNTPGIGRDHTGADRLFGGDGDDKIFVGKDDVATGGNGQDTFVFVFTGKLGVTSARITDFDSTEDKLKIAYTDALGSAPRIDLKAHSNGDDLIVEIARTDITKNNGQPKDLRQLAVIEDGASLGLTVGDFTFETFDF